MSHNPKKLIEKDILQGRRKTGLTHVNCQSKLEWSVINGSDIEKTKDTETGLYDIEYMATVRIKAKRGVLYSLGVSKAPDQKPFDTQQIGAELVQKGAVMQCVGHTDQPLKEGESLCLVHCWERFDGSDDDDDDYKNPPNITVTKWTIRTQKIGILNGE